MAMIRELPVETQKLRDEIELNLTGMNGIDGPMKETLLEENQQRILDLLDWFLGGWRDRTL